MSDTIELAAEPREATGKGPSRALRRADRVPGIVYGEGKEPIKLSVAGRELRRLIDAGTFMTSLCELSLGKEKIRVLPKEVQVHPVSDRPVHVDFTRVSRGARVTVEVHVQFVGEEDSPGLKRGGVLNIVRREVEVECPAEAIPDHLTLDLSGADIGDSLHISQVTLPNGVEPTIDDRDFTIASITPPTVAPVEEEVAEEEEAGEVATVRETEDKAAEQDEESSS
ncbi:50S ribosomal protein L25/general stress protein Ctc [Marinivivus vitaminiproducens]|uniref:50S ribosomal protein L25/general stress protein Ctc n=1 Tax=Marinivivus vitaminiproducens TaxID=3035935 RepID=UPI0027A2D9C0|nr:50S ribosomal protein L25/general stress protein Ctc [Geminicoccaceae bacterium SCSIO 64248]